MATKESQIPNRIMDLIANEELESDEELCNLIRFYAKLKKGGDGELVVKLLKGKLAIKGVTYIMPD